MAVAFNGQLSGAICRRQRFILQVDAHSFCGIRLMLAHILWWAAKDSGPMQRGM